MWQPVKIEINNLMSHLDTTYYFPKYECVLLYGVNDSDDGMDSNGAGKSTVLEGITIALTGLPSRDIRKDEFITDDEDETYIEFHLTNEIGTVNDLVIKRWFYRKKSSRIELWENGSLNKQMTSVLEADKRIFELIGISKEDLLHFFIIGQDTNYSFLTASDTEMKKIIGRFSDTTFVSDKINNLKDKGKIKQAEYNDLDSTFNKIEGKIEAIQEQIQDEADKKEIEVEDVRIVNIEADIKSRKLSIIEEKNNIKVANKKIKEHLETLSEKRFTEIGDVEKLNIQKNKRRKEKRLLKSDLEEAEKQLRKFKVLMDGEIECPKCEHHFILNSDIPLEEIPTSIEASEESIKNCNDLIKSIDKTIDKIEKKIEVISEIMEEKDEIESAIRKLKDRSIFNSNKAIEAYEKHISNNLKAIDRIKTEVIEDDSTFKLEERLKEQQELLKSTKTLMKDISVAIDDINFWVHHFGTKGFQTFLTNKSIKSIEGMTNSILQHINTDLQLSISGFTVLKSGELREKIDIAILRNGMTVGNFNRYSGGEKGRINLSNIIAMQKLFNMNAPNGGLNFLGLDEVFEGLDITGQKEMISILVNMKITTMVISHRNEPIGVDNEIMIEKIDGYSFIRK